MGKDSDIDREEVSDIEESEEEEEEEDEEERKSLIKQIDAYWAAFPAVLNKKSQTNQKKRIKEGKKYTKFTPISVIKKDLEQIKTQVAADSSKDTTFSIAMLIASAIEMLAPESVSLSGPEITLKQIVARKEATYDRIFKELMCKYGGDALVEPEARLVMLLGCDVYATSTRNKEAKAKIEGNTNTNSVINAMKNKSNTSTIDESEVYPE